jgi:hypothetical protein
MLAARLRTLSTQAGHSTHGTVAFYDPVRTYAAFKDWVPLRRALACNIERSLSQ